MRTPSQRLMGYEDHDHYTKLVITAYSNAGLNACGSAQCRLSEMICTSASNQGLSFVTHEHHYLGQSADEGPPACFTPVLPVTG